MELNGGQRRFSVRHVHENPAFIGDQDTIGIPNGLESKDSYLLSLRHLTKEALPRIEQYRNTKSVQYANRPTLEELHEGIGGRDVPDVVDMVEQPEASGHVHVKFGWIEGVLVLNVMSLWGPMLFLRTSWLVGQGGLIHAIVLILFATLITTITALSTSAIATNGEVKGGGTFYMLSRSLGPEFGGAIGLVFAFANMVGVAMNIVGFCEGLQALMRNFDVKIVDNGLNDIRIVGVLAAIFCMIVCLVGMEWEQKAQIVFLIVLLVAIFDVFIGSFVPADAVSKARGVTGWNVAVGRQNLLPDYRGDVTFVKMFAVYFPSATGILSGANISGELKDPQAAIPKGTLLAILITTSSYVLFAIIAALCIIRDASGNVEDYYAGNYTACAQNFSCKDGIANNDQMIEMVAGYRWLVHAGNFAATLSSALACLVGAPRVFQALCRDDIYPYIKWFGKGYGPTDDPRRCYGLTFVIAVAFILIGNLNLIAPIMSNFFLAAFALINFAVVHAVLVKSPGFRPSFKYYNAWVSFVGGLICIIVMFVLDYITAIVTVLICAVLVIYLLYNRPNVNWGSSTQAQNYILALKLTQGLNMTEEHVKNYRPHVLVLTGKPMHRPQLVDLCNYITKGYGLMVCGHVSKPPVSERYRNNLCNASNAWLMKRKCRAFYSIIEEDSMENGAKALLQLVGIGKLRPNMLMLGYKNNWLVCEDSEVTAYFKILHDAFDRCMAVGILRMRDGLDYSYFMDDPCLVRTESSSNILGSSNSLSDSVDTLHTSQSTVSLDTALAISTPSNVTIVVDEGTKAKSKKEKKKRKQSLANLPKEIIDNVNWFREKRTGTIDVWWLYDDGGLTMLVPYILSNRKDWAGCSLRVFALANDESQLDEEHRNMVGLLRKFRIAYEDVIILPDIGQSASDNTVKEFRELVNRFQEPYRKAGSELSLTSADILEHKERSNRYMRVREKLVEHSLQSTLIVMTLPIPRKIGVPTALYMTWLEMLTRQMPPFLLIRGNQTSVLTFYS